MSKAIITITDEKSDKQVNVSVQFEGRRSSSVEKLTKVTLDVIQEVAKRSGDFQPFVPTPISCGLPEDENDSGS